MRQRHALYLSDTMSRQLQLMAETHRISKSQILEAALQRYLNPDCPTETSEMHRLQQETNQRALRRLERDLAIATELMATFVRYFVTITPPLPQSQHAPARALGQLRFEQVIEDVARRLGTDRSLMARVSSILAAGHPRTSSDNALTEAPDEPPASDTVPGGIKAKCRDG